MVATSEFKSDLGLLVESGLIAIKQGDKQSAEALFKAVDILDPKSNHATMGRGLIALHEMEIEQSREHFNTILEQEPQNYRAKAFLAFANILSVLQEGSEEQKVKSLQEGAALAQEVLDHCEEKSTRELAQSLLDWESELQKGE